MVQIYSVRSNAYQLDGGAMFGNAPRALWERWIPADEQNRLHLTTRAMLALAGEEVILFETGIGNYLEPKLRERFGVHEPDNVLVKTLAQHGVSPADVTRIFFTHMHFDHVGGLLSPWQEGKEPEIIFPNAQVYAGEDAWERATHPHPRDRASFIPALHRQLEQSGRLTLVQKDETFAFGDLEVRFFRSDGHTPGLLAADLRFPGGRVVFPTDLIPGRFWVHLPISMGYDRFPELLIEEKKTLLTSLAEDNGWLVYVHDPDYAASRVRPSDDGASFLVVDPQKELVIE